MLMKLERIELLQRNPYSYVDPSTNMDGDKNTKDVEKLLSYVYLFNKNPKDMIKLCR